MEKNKNGGPAFPIPYETAMMERMIPAKGSLGMSLRDYFAGQALAGIMSNPMYMVALVEKNKSVSTECYEFADAMLAAREAK